LTDHHDQSLANEELLNPEALKAVQQRKFALLFRHVNECNAFYQRKLKGMRFDPSHDPLPAFPFTTRAEIEQDQRASPPYGTILTYPTTSYSRFHQTSGTGGVPVRWLDTAESWEWVKRCWSVVLRAAGIKPGDRLLFPFSFGPFLGFWSAFESACALGCLCLPAGGMTTSARLRMLRDNAVNAVFCTPTYALHMAEVARTEGVDLAALPVRALIVAGEPGGSIPSVRQRIESAWGARVFDHNGMTETGPVGFECQQAPGGLHVIESEYIAEVIDPVTHNVVPEGEQGELVLTNLGRLGSPLIRYRTGDLVRVSRGQCACGSSCMRLEGGVLGRLDDMFIVRGNNVFPSAVEAVLRQFPEVAEFRLRVRHEGPLAEVRLDIEPSAEASDSASRLAEQVSRAVQTALAFRAEVCAVPCGSLPRFEMKARRFVREDNQKVTAAT
jgi:phenylacetate-CoA ligase